MTVRNFIVHNAKKFRLKIPYRYRIIVVKTKQFHSVMTSMTMFAQKSKSI